MLTRNCDQGQSLEGYSSKQLFQIYKMNLQNHIKMILQY